MLLIDLAQTGCFACFDLSDTKFVEHISNHCQAYKYNLTLNFDLDPSKVNSILRH